MVTAQDGVSLAAGIAARVQGEHAHLALCLLYLAMRSRRMAYYYCSGHNVHETMVEVPSELPCLA